jgi:hypothetical protein
MGDDEVYGPPNQHSWLVPKDAERLRAVRTKEQADALWEQESAILTPEQKAQYEKHHDMHYDTQEHTNDEWFRAILLVRDRFDKP